MCDSEIIGLHKTLTDTTHSYRARWIIPVAGPPVSNGIVVVHGERVIGIHRTRRPDTVDLGEVAILPGLVNCHTHLEFSGLASPLTPMTPFTAWIREVVNYRRSMSEGVPAAIRSGLRESLDSGVTLLGDIATTGWSWPDYSDGPECVVFQELLGLSAARIPELVAIAERHSASKHAGLSPHAPYSVHPELFQQAVRLAQSANVPLAMHLAETQAEQELLAEGTGEFRTLLQDFGLWQPELFGGREWSEFLEPFCDLPRALIVHGNYFNPDDLRLLAQHPHLTLVYCPRTHAAFGHPPNPWRTLLNLGGSVALGTDSRASNPDLSLWKEVQFLAANFRELSHLELVRLATWNGARALNRHLDHGTIESGKLANLVVVGPVPDDGPTLHHSLITNESQIQRVMHRGQWLQPL